ncbi:MAG: hypothetical protein KGQ60_18485, partial [Planctomycetes bacterium]|nr:hypothetical protein [Planctomycetota bacterium]
VSGSAPTHRTVNPLTSFAARAITCPVARQSVERGSERELSEGKKEELDVGIAAKEIVFVWEFFGSGLIVAHRARISSP